jgi:hypothetical protein
MYGANPQRAAPIHSGRLQYTAGTRDLASAGVAPAVSLWLIDLENATRLVTTETRQTACTIYQPTRPYSH